MSISGRASSLAKRAAVAFGASAVVLAVAGAALGFLIAACYVWLTQRFGTAQAAAITGGTLLLLALILALAAGTVMSAMRRRQPPLFSEFGGTLRLGLRLIAMAVRRDPRKAIILSVIAGALAEYITAERERRK